MARKKKKDPCLMEGEPIKLEDIRDEKAMKKFSKIHNKAKSAMEQRTRGHQIFSKISHMQNLYETRGDTYSEGSTQAIKRKIRAQTIQRVPDGEITTQFDKNSLEQVEIEFIFQHKIMTSEYDGKDMLKYLWRAFNASYDYGFACVRTGFEDDADGDIRISQTLIQWNDIWPDPDCKFIEEANWYLVREWISRSDIKQLIDENGNLVDDTYNEDVVKYILQNHIRDGIDTNSQALADKRQMASPQESFEVWTWYKRGASEFETYVPSCEAILRTVKNYDPRKDVPLHFMILEPDPEFPLGCSSVLWTLSQQQFADAYQTTAYQTLLLAVQPPMMAYGNLTPSKYKMRPRAIWPMGTNPNNKIEKFPIETTTLTQYGQILQNVSSNMMKNLNVADGTVATDAHTMNYSGTPQGVEAQRADKTITINQYQKRVEIFFSEWANHALRSYLNSMSGVQQLTVDEKTRRRIYDIETQLTKIDPEYESILDENKISIDFGKLSADMLEFEVRTGSLIQSQQEEERKNIQELLIPITQMLSAVSDQNKQLFESNIMRLMARLCELSDVDIPVQTSAPINESLAMEALKATMGTVMQQQQQIDGMQGQLMNMAAQQQAQQGMPPEQAAPPEMAGQPMPAEAPMQPPTEGAPLSPEELAMMRAQQQGQPGAMPPEAAIPPEAEVSAEFPEQTEG